MRTFLKMLFFCVCTILHFIAGMWLMMKYCFWVNCGWCHDWTPLYMYFFGGILGLIASFFLYRAIFKKHTISFNNILKGFLPLMLFISAGFYFKTTESMRSKLMRPVKYGSIEEVKAVLNDGANPDACDSFCRESALFFAVRRKSVEKIEVLIQAGADVNFRETRHNKSVLDIAVVVGDKEIIRLLKESGAK